MLKKVKKKIIKVTIIGCGNIGALYDLRSKNKKLTLSHLKAFNENKNFQIVACIDPNIANLSTLKKMEN